MKYFGLIAIIIALSGCSSGTTSITSPLGGVDTNSSDIGRFTAWAAVEQQKAQAIQAIETAAKPEPAKENIQVVLDTEQKIQAWASYQSSLALKDAVVAMAKALTPQRYGKALETTAMPRGAGAEFVDSASGFIGTLAGSPAAVAGATGYFISSVAKGAVAGNRIVASDGATVHVNQATAKGTSLATADSSTKTTTTTMMSETSIDNSVGPVTTDNSDSSDNSAVNTDNSDRSDNSTTDNSIGPVDNSDNSTSTTNNHPPMQTEVNLIDIPDPVIE